MIDPILFALFAMMVLTALAAIRLHDLFAVVIMFTIYSLLAASMFVQMDAVDVAFTEAAVGAGVSTILMLATLVLTDRWEKPSKHRPLLPLVVVVLTGAALVYGTLDLPLFGDPGAPVNVHVTPRYLGQSPEEIGIPNVVTSVLASYRGYDTFGELTVIFTAGIGVMVLLGVGGRRRAAAAMRSNPVLRIVSKLMIPAILLFALYVQFHGDFGPGGGFQAGVIFAAAFILYAMVFGLGATEELIPVRLLRWFVAAGVFLYGGVGVATMLLGGDFLDYNMLAHDGKHGQHLGIFLVELGVGTTVAAAMLTIFLAFAGRSERR